MNKHFKVKISNENTVKIPDAILKELNLKSGMDLNLLCLSNCIICFSDDELNILKNGE